MKCVNEAVHLRGGGDNNPGNGYVDAIEVGEPNEQEQQQPQEEEEQPHPQEHKQQSHEQGEQQQQQQQQQQQKAALEKFITPGGASHDKIQESKERMLLRAAFHVRYVWIFNI